MSDEMGKESADVLLIYLRGCLNRTGKDGFVSVPRSYIDRAIALLSASPASPSPATGVRVKKLDWRKTSYGTPEVYSVVGVCRINHAMNGGWSATIGREVLREKDGRENFATLQDAIDAVQADYAAKVLSALVEQP